MTPRRRTEDLIAELAGQPVPAPFRPGLAALALSAAVAAGVALFWLAFGLRPGLGAALSTPIPLVKSLLPFGLAALALALALGSARPDARVPVWTLALPVGLGLALFVWRLAVAPDGQVLTELVGQTAAACLVSITTLGLLPTLAALALLRGGAPARPGVTGALVGLASGAGVAAGYALHCPEDSPLFFVVWYGTGIAVSSAIGAAAAARMLRW